MLSLIRIVTWRLSFDAYGLRRDFNAERSYSFFMMADQDSVGVRGPLLYALK